MSASPETSYLSALEEWRAQRIATLVKPDGWLSVSGLAWLEPGTWRFGSSPDNDIVIERAPAFAGTIRHDGNGKVHVRLDPSAGGTIDGEAMAESALSDDPIAPILVAFGPVSFFLIDREGRKALRIRDSESPKRRTFLGIPHFPVDPSWRIVADWVALAEARPFEVDSITGMSSTVLASHKAVFRRAGAEVELWPTHGTPAAPMFVLRDATSGQETYGAGRFLVGEVLGDTIVLDLNKAINPPCAFTDYATCPLPPPENRLKLRIEAGEKIPSFRKLVSDVFEQGAP
jgi:uncharacterized protein (DUF1684 family)